MPSSSSPPNQLTVKAHAKINLALRITGKRPDGYHNLSTIFQAIDFYDRLTFTPAEKFTLTTSVPDLPTDERNLCHRAYWLMHTLNQSSSTFAIHLEKNIPQGAGLGGGSADAAAVLKFLNRAWGLNLSVAHLEQLGQRLGADVPFCIRGGTQAASGIGEILLPFKLPYQLAILLVIPPLAVSTAWAYRQFQPGDCRAPFDFGALITERQIRWELFENQFEQVVFPAFPDIAQIKTTLLQTNALYVGLSGSGATVFGIYRHQGDAQAAADRFPHYRTVVTTSLDTSEPFD